MDSLPNDWLALAALVFVLGMKHGCDADHLATIDGLTRFNARHRPRLARFCGALFSLGHGCIVLATALAVGTAAGRWQLPEWLEVFGAGVSIVVLVILGLLNLQAVLNAAPGEMVQPLGVRGRLFARLQRTTRPLAMAALGALFALSFDTLSQASLFALAALRFGGWGHALALGLAFTAGMLATDGINGLWIARLLRRADAAAVVASRLMGLVVAGGSLAVAALGLMRLASPAVSAWSEGKDLVFGAALVAVVAAAYLVSLRLIRRPQIA